MKQRIRRKEVEFLIEVGEVVEIESKERLKVDALHEHVGRELERTERAAEANLLIIVDELTAHGEHRVFRHRIVHRRDQLGRRRAVQVSTDELGAEQGMQWPNGVPHSPLSGGLPRGLAHFDDAAIRVDLDPVAGLDEIERVAIEVGH